ncbi:MAG: M20/M25/M40 family metallo-hydrolase, partial [Paracoccaceae bacterium]
GTTPMDMRCDAGIVAARIAVEARAIADDMGGHQVATVGVIDLKPNLVNVVPNRAVLTVDLRNTDEQLLQQAEARLIVFADMVVANEGVNLERRILARFEPVVFAPEMIDLVEQVAKGQGLSTRRMPSGAGHDAQMFAPNCPTSMVFVPSRDGVSHNIREFTEPEDIRAGANVLLHVVIKKAEE